jgi:transcriptional regulator with XRE-family HTH domain
MHLDADLVRFGKRVRAARIRLAMNQREVAQLVGTDGGTISRWERGDGYPQTKQLVKLARALGESLDHLVLGAQSEKTSDVMMPRAFIDFLKTDHGRIAQQRNYVPVLLSIRYTSEPTVRFYQAIVAGLMLSDDNP